MGNVTFLCIGKEEGSAFIHDIRGKFTLEALTEMQSYFNEEIDEFYQGDGDYKMLANHNSGQFDEMGRCEFPPHWELDLIKFTEIEELTHNCLHQGQ